MQHVDAVSLHYTVILIYTYVTSHHRCPNVRVPSWLHVRNKNTRIRREGVGVGVEKDRIGVGFLWGGSVPVDDGGGRVRPVGYRRSGIV